LAGIGVPAVAPDGIRACAGLFAFSSVNDGKMVDVAIRFVVVAIAIAVIPVNLVCSRQVKPCISICCNRFQGCVYHAIDDAIGIIAARPAFLRIRSEVRHCTVDLNPVTDLAGPGESSRRLL